MAWALQPVVQICLRWGSFELHILAVDKLWTFLHRLIHDHEKIRLMGRYHKVKGCGYKEVFCYFWFSGVQHKTINSPGNHWLDCNITLPGTQICPSVPLHAEHAGVVQLISFPLSVSGCIFLLSLHIFLLSLHMKHLKMHKWFRKLSALRQVNPFHPDIRKQ